jgi:radical SAM superfamily enzyme YgiQ (UPF0313 family)
MTVCKELADAAPGMRWTAYVKYQPFNLDFFRALKDSGCYMVTLSLETTPDKTYTLQRLANFFSFAKKADVQVVVDLLTGFPGEKEENARDFINFLKTQPLQSVGINNYIRIYPGCKIRKIVESGDEFKNKLINYKPGTDYVQPVFFNWFSSQKIKEFIGDAENFRLEGEERKCNYQRVKTVPSIPRREVQRPGTTKIKRRRL